MLRWFEASARPAAGLAILTRRILRPAECSISEDEQGRAAVKIVDDRGIESLKIVEMR